MALSLAALQTLRPVQTPDYTARARTLADARNAMQTEQMNALKIHAATTEAEQLQAVQQALIEAQGDVEAALPKILQVAPTLAPQYQKYVEDTRASRIDRDVKANTMARQNFQAMEGQETPSFGVAAPVAEAQPYEGQVGAGPQMGGGTRRVATPMPAWLIPGSKDLNVAGATVYQRNAQQIRDEEAEKARQEQEMELEKIRVREQAQAEFATPPRPTEINTPFELWRQQNPQGTAAEWLKLQQSQSGSGGALSPYAESNILNRLVTQWDKAQTDVKELYRANTIMNAGLEAAKRGDMNAGSQAVLVTFQKFLDPTSVVRESEYARSSQGLSVAQRARGYMTRLMEGGAGMTLDELQTFANLAREINNELAKEGNSLLAKQRDRISRNAKHYQIPEDLVFSGFDFALPAEGTAPPNNQGREQFSPSTGQYRHSLDGGQTWRNGRLPR